MWVHPSLGMKFFLILYVISSLAQVGKLISASTSTVEYNSIAPLAKNHPFRKLCEAGKKVVMCEKLEDLPYETDNTAESFSFGNKTASAVDDYNYKRSEYIDASVGFEVYQSVPQTI